MPRLFLFSDLHLSRDMSEFGEHWIDHVAKIEAVWDATIRPDDVVAVPGDVSFAGKRHHVEKDLAWLAARPGTVLIVKGNHDWWWDRTAKIRPMLPRSVIALDGDAVRLHGAVFAGAKGYMAPNDPYFKVTQDQRPYDRAMIRVERALSLAEQTRLQQPHPDDTPVYLLLHYPPFTSEGDETTFVPLIERHPAVQAVLFGHFHHRHEWQALEPTLQARNSASPRYYLGPVDYLGFQPQHIADLPSKEPGA